MIVEGIHRQQRRWAMSPRGGAPTNEQIIRLLEAVRADLAESKRQQDKIARNVERLMAKKTA
jgi:hypothetical protein